MAEALIMPQRQAPANRPQGQAAQEGGGGGGFPIRKIALGGAIYFGLNFAIGQYMKKDQTGIRAPHPVTGELTTVPGNIGEIPPFQFRPDQPVQRSPGNSIPHNIAPIWAQDSHLDIVVALSPSFNPVPISQTPPEYVVMDEKDFHMNNYSDKRSIDTTFKVPPTVQNNGTLWAHIFIGLSGSSLDIRSPSFSSDNAYHMAWPLTQYLPKKHVAKTRNLLGGKSDDADEEADSPKTPIITNHYHPNASFNIIPDLGVKDFKGFPPASRQFLRLEASGARDATGKNGWYYPLFFVDTFWQLKTHMVPLNGTVTELPLHIDLKNMVAWQFHLLSGVEASARESARQAAYGNAPAGGDGSEIEMIKEVFIDTNPILLAITAIVTVAHLILETLAFGSDIAHYRKKKDNVGISVRSILANVFMQTVIFLYLLDNSDNTSWMILGTQVVGIVIEFWKITTVVDVRVRPAPQGSLIPYQVVFEDKHKLTETEERTKEYDEIAFKYMYWAGVPLLIAYGIYSLYYDSHKSWYSYIITTLVGSVYAYGFLMMVPSLYINYRLKSVAHMPAKAMMYKFLNTFIDDLFAFTIKMPFLHRLATFRDDIIFFIYVYQRWKYTIDYTRVNEFGQGGEDEAEDKIEADGKVAAVEAIKEVEGKVKAKATGADTGSATKRK